MSPLRFSLTPGRALRRLASATLRAGLVGAFSLPATVVSADAAAPASNSATALAPAPASTSAPAPARAPAVAPAFGFDNLAALAQQAASGPWQTPGAALPAELAALSYDALRDIRFRPDQAVWRADQLPFELQFFHLGGGQTQAVEVNVLVDGAPQHLPYDPAEWAFGANRLQPGRWGNLGQAGFRVHHALNSPQYLDELVTFLGASYFRALGRGQQYGLSARGLAVDTLAGASGERPEEFPRFTRFWVERPAPNAQKLTVLALMASASVTGAYRFVVSPGQTTTLDVQARLYLRAGLTRPPQLGLAPLTSMFLHGENQPSRRDFRPEVHDSDGLALATAQRDGSGTEWLWRPLVNPGGPLVSSFAVARLQGFGLMQRDRRFVAYEDSEARYERRPSAWVEPVGDWGPGQVVLLQLPTPDETEDNVVAFWAPAALPPVGQAVELAYRLHWQGDALQLPPNGWTVQSRRGRGWGQAAPGELQFVVDFDGPALQALPDDAAVQAVASAGANARITEARAWRHPASGWRMQLRAVRLDPAQPMALRAYLRHGDAALTETWAALVPVDPPTAAAAGD